jgi:hypothetical protein
MLKCLLIYFLSYKLQFENTVNIWFMSYTVWLDGLQCWLLLQCLCMSWNIHYLIICMFLIHVHVYMCDILICTNLVAMHIYVHKDVG